MSAMPIAWFDATAAKALGLNLAETLATGFAASEKRKGQIAIAKRTRLLENLFTQVKQFEKRTSSTSTKKRNSEMPSNGNCWSLVLSRTSSMS